MVQRTAIHTMADQQKVVYDLSNGAIFNDLKRPLPPVSRSRHYLTLNHRLRGSASTVLTATGQVNGRWRILTPHRIETHEPTATKFRTIDYVHGRTP